MVLGSSVLEALLFFAAVVIGFLPAIRKRFLLRQHWLHTQLQSSRDNPLFITSSLLSNPCPFVFLYTHHSIMGGGGDGNMNPLLP